MAPSSQFSLLRLPNGVNIAYEILGTRFLGYRRPIVLISGLSIVRKDWSLLAQSLAQSRPVLVYDHRGIGDSVCSPSAVEEISIETMTLDLLALLIHLKWKEIAICGWSMGGVVAQQLLVLPFHPHRPRTLPFRVTHVFLAGTRSVVLSPDQHGFQKRVPQTLTPEERMKLVRTVLARTFDPTWLSQNQAHFENLFRGWLTGVRPAGTIAKQQQAVASFNFHHLLAYIPRDIKILVIHGELDQIIPYSAGRDIPSYIPSAKFMSIGRGAGQVYSPTFGHCWFQYFNINMWREVLERHMSS
ncbi:hypothetical protein GYMLUDRAFT_45343 [Collybiopsis luxurians FD-317 M1]|uniref:AB hydrolase-1 domain-containing protein n=1 Tax=Collybiopsis luxurians FD-317 M1 TaxID=944289 RepID=A0A0D0C6K8_9AGAR|nr:hypothetical protein GYMLUDRAFT_45343 [Collybiopsis luxurians FD-317 M1]